MCVCYNNMYHHQFVHSVKFVNAKQARKICEYKNTKEKLLKTNTAIWFNKICKLHHLTQKYINGENDCVF
jgi:hypothetical protein